MRFFSEEMCWKGKGFLCEPTLVRAENHWKVVQRETFAPILYVMSYQTLDDAIALHNQVPQGLSSSLFTLNLRHAEEVFILPGERLWHCQCQYWHLWSGNWWSLWRRKRNRWGAGGRVRCVESLYAAADQYH